MAKITSLLSLPFLLGAAVVFLTGILESIVHDTFPKIDISPLYTRVFASSLLIFLSLFIIYRAVRTYIFDVISWTLESERNYQFASRERVIRYSQRLIRKVAAHPGCDSITIVSHSLGSCIATEALLREGAREKALGRQKEKTFLHKVKSVFTIGSPIDLIFFFFQADQTFSHRYSRIAEERRLSISLPPFWFAGTAGTAAIYNVWSRFDPISSAMHGLRKRMSERRNAITNIEVLPKSAPSPIAAHTSYFADPNVMSPIYSSVMGTEIRFNKSGLKAFFEQNTELGRFTRAKPWALPTVALLGLAPTWTWISVFGWLGTAVLLVWLSNARLKKGYQGRFGRYLSRNERGIDGQTLSR